MTETQADAPNRACVSVPRAAPRVVGVTEAAAAKVAVHVKAAAVVAVTAVAAVAVTAVAGRTDVMKGFASKAKPFSEA